VAGATAREYPVIIGGELKVSFQQPVRERIIVLLWQHTTPRIVIPPKLVIEFDQGTGIQRNTGCWIKSGIMRLVTLIAVIVRNKS